MDLLQTVRKEGSRGGRDEFKWEDVKTSGHRENYLGHSLMAPVGRWQKGRDLSWYAKADGDEKTEAEKRADELRKVKEAEEDAMAKALGLPPPERNNANLTPLGTGDVTKSIPSIPESELSRDKGKALRGREKDADRVRRRRSPTPDAGRRRDQKRRERDGSRHRHRRHHSRSRSRSRSRDRTRRRRSRSREIRHDEHRRHRSRERPRTKDRHRRSRSPRERGERRR